MILSGKTLLLTGGTGSFGQAYAKYLVQKNELDRLIIFSRDEQKHYEMMREFADSSFQIDFVIGDVRDRDKVMSVCKGVDVIIHSAAMKHMPMAEAHPQEAIKTNILGSQNIIDGAIANEVEKVVALSTDKAALPVNTYGATKFLLERLFISADSLPTNTSTRFSLVRYANVFGSKGSVVPLFQKFKSTGTLPITDPEMTRFSITMTEGIDLVEFAIKSGLGGEIIVPIAPSYKVGDVAKAIGPNCKQEIIGARNGEKMHEVLVSSFEAPFTVKKDNYYLITPPNGRVSMDQYGEKVSELIQYSSDLNGDWLSVAELEELTY